MARRKRRGLHLQPQHRAGHLGWQSGSFGRQNQMALRRLPVGVQRRGDRVWSLRDSSTWIRRTVQGKTGCKGQRRAKCCGGFPWNERSSSCQHGPCFDNFRRRHCWYRVWCSCGLCEEPSIRICSCSGFGCSNHRFLWVNFRQHQLRWLHVWGASRQHDDSTTFWCTRAASHSPTACDDATAAAAGAGATSTESHSSGCHEYGSKRCYSCVWRCIAATHSSFRRSWSCRCSSSATASSGQLASAAAGSTAGNEYEHPCGGSSQYKV
mmetsp:Transcript_64991/g.163765  ORF Transcript_64991/g.163765 Transcript_64991/m.163765 type:complete len:266 (+) Transcript_64991:3666-4463(+)